MIAAQELCSRASAKTYLRNIDTISITSIKKGHNQPDEKPFYVKKTISPEINVRNIDFAFEFKKAKKNFESGSPTLSVKKFSGNDQNIDLVNPYLIAFVISLLFLIFFLVFSHAILTSPVGYTFGLGSIIAIGIISDIIGIACFIFLMCWFVTRKKENQKRELKVVFMLFFIYTFLCGLLSLTLVNPFFFFSYIPTALLFLTIALICLTSLILLMVHIKD